VGSEGWGSPSTGLSPPAQSPPVQSLLEGGGETFRRFNDRCCLRSERGSITRGDEVSPAMFVRSISPGAGVGVGAVVRPTRSIAAGESSPPHVFLSEEAAAKRTAAGLHHLWPHGRAWHRRFHAPAAYGCRDSELLALPSSSRCRQNARNSICLQNHLVGRLIMPHSSATLNGQAICRMSAQDFGVLHRTANRGNGRARWCVARVHSPSGPLVLRTDVLASSGACRMTLCSRSSGARRVQLFHSNKLNMKQLECCGHRVMLLLGHMWQGAPILRSWHHTGRPCMKNWYRLAVSYFCRTGANTLCIKT